MHVHDDHGAQRSEDREESDAAGGDDGEVGVSGGGKQGELHAEEDAPSRERVPEGVEDLVRRVQTALELKGGCGAAMCLLEDGHIETLTKVQKSIILQCSNSPGSGNLSA